MAFLDNSGDIILDAVLTDTGRYRLAKGDGSFRVNKFALGDDEINYRIYDKNHPSGSAYYDLSILQTPILEAFTDNAAGLKSKLITISRNNLVFLPIIKLNETAQGTQRSAQGVFYVSCDQDTIDKLSANNNNQDPVGVIRGYGNQVSARIRLDQGLDTAGEYDPTMPLDSDLIETQYILEIDNRLGQISSITDNAAASISYIDDDDVASCFLTDADANYVATNTVTTRDSTQVIDGPRGTILQFTIKASTNLAQGYYFFDQFGGSTTINGTAYRYIDSTVRVMGASTGYRVDIPVRFLKL